MKKAITFLSGILVAIAGWIILQKFEIHGWQDLQRSSRDRFSRGSPLEPSPTSANLPPSRSAGSIRVATFNIQVFGDSKAKKPHVMDILARIVRQFDVVAIQEVCSKSQDLIPNFLDLVNAGGRHYDYLVGPRLGRNDSKEQYVFIYDMATVEVDRSQLYTVADPDDLLHWEPLVAWFRVRGPPPDQAFTFSLVNVHVEPDEAQQELEVLADVYRGVRNDGRQEDDVIILGNLNADFEHLGRLGQISGMTSAIRGLPTNTRGTHQLDNLVFHGLATAEYTGRSGVFDFLREYNLTLEEALEVSDHLPVWAEFSVYEGGQPGRLAERPDSKTR
ncbi:MAG: endonuclease/exonuclease/phosphatase family protein [Planctomycetota bacterium]|nr:endonuclease/exonuclease/phosphatase family protein [Planctomycetota bacterium]